MVYNPVPNYFWFRGTAFKSKDVISVLVETISLLLSGDKDILLIESADL